MLTKPVYLEIDKPNYVPIYTVQYDYNSRFYEITILNNSQPLDLTGIRVIVAGKKPDGKEVFNSCKVLDAKKGLIQLELTEQMNAVNGASEYALELFSADGMLSSQPFKLIVTRSTISKTVESSKELGALKDALNEVQDIDNRFAQTNAQLSQLANKGTTVEVLERVTKEEIDRQIADGTIANLTIADESITTDKLAKKSVDYDNLKWVEVSRLNLCPNNFTEGVYIHPDGSFVNGNYKVSDFIKVESGVNYCANSGGLYFCCYDANKEVVRISQENWINPIRISDNVAYVRLTYSLNESKPIFNQGDKLISYVPYDVIEITTDDNFNNYLKGAVSKIVSTENNSIDASALIDNSIDASKFNFVIGYNNLYDANSLSVGLVDGKGVVTEQPSYPDARTTDFIPVNEGKTLVLISKTRMHYHSAFYDENKNFVKFVAGGFIGTITVPTGMNIKYFRLGLSSTPPENSMIYEDHEVFEKTPPAFVPFGEKGYVILENAFLKKLYENFKDLDRQTSMFRTNLPKQIELVEGDAFELFYDSIIDVVKPSNYNLTFSGDSWSNGVRAFDRKIYYESPTSINTKDISIAWTDDNKDTVATVNTSIKVYPKKNPSRSVNVLIIGDSLTDRQGTVKTLAQKMKDEGFSNVNFIGTRSSGYEGAYHEGRSGWKISDYLSKPNYNGNTPNDPNPFWYDGECNFERYCQENNFSSIDYCIIHLNWNDGWRNAEAHVNRYDALIQKLLSYYPNCKVILVSVPFRNTHEYNTCWASCVKSDIFNLNDAMEEYCAEHDKIHFINTFMQCDSEYNVVLKEFKVNIRNDKTESVLEDHVHPSLAGYQQIADAYYRKLNYLFNIYE